MTDKEQMIYDLLYLQRALNNVIVQEVDNVIKNRGNVDRLTESLEYQIQELTRFMKNSDDAKLEK